MVNQRATPCVASKALARMTSKERDTLHAEIMARMVEDPDTGCLAWTGPKGSRGHGTVNLGSRSQSAPVYRVLYILSYGPLRSRDWYLHGPCGAECNNLSHSRGVGPAAWNTAQAIADGTHVGAVTECPAGHPYDKENTRMTYSVKAGKRRPQRSCRTCLREARRERYNTDPEFRERSRARQREYNERKRQGLTKTA